MRALCIGVTLLVGGSFSSCKSKSTVASGTRSIGPQFWLYDVSDYDRTDEDVESGIGGRWISVRYEAKSGATIDRDAKVDEIIKSFQEDGWFKVKLPSSPYVMSKIYETGTDDLYFKRRAKDDEPAGWQFANAIHISPDGSVICSYCEVAW